MNSNCFLKFKFFLQFFLEIKMIPKSAEIFLIFCKLFFNVLKISSYSIDCNDFCQTIKNPSYPTNCFCSDCDSFSDCCIDRPLPIKKSIMQCSSKISKNYYIYSVDFCDEKFITNNKANRFIKEKCEAQNETYLPYNLPAFSTEDNLIYKNIFCAKCNFKNISKIKMFSIYLKNNYDETFFNKEIINQLLEGKRTNLENFELSLNPPENVVPRMCKKAIDSCPANFSNVNISRLCQDATAYRYTYAGLSYKNEHCAICNNQNVDFLHCIEKIDYYSFVNSLQILFDLSELNDNSNLDLKVKYNDLDLDFNNSVSFHHLSNRECNKMLDQDLSKKYLTIIGQAISISSLSLLILIYVKNKLYANLPGKMLLSLSSSLLMSQIFFLISTYTTKSLADKSQKENCDFAVGSDLSFKRINEILPCYITGVLTHFFHLNFFIWTSLMAFDLLRMFQKFGKIINDSNKYIRYSLISFILPIISIGILHLKNMNKLSYGIKNCFISNSVDILVFFVAPIATILFLNLVFLMLSVYFIKKVDILSAKYISQDKLSSTNKKGEKSRLLLFAKLFILTGMTWLIGVISSLMNDKYSVLWYFYIILNSLQGLFIFCTYGFNHNSKSNIKTNVTKIMSYFTKDRSIVNDKSSRTNSSENPVSISK